MFPDPDAAQCENGWQVYKDELCIKVYETELVTYEEATSICLLENNPSASMVMVKSAEIQAFLTNHTQNVYDNLWLGGKYDNQSAQFRWEDGEALTYTNWAEGFPRNVTDVDVCISMRPTNAKDQFNSNNSMGNWEDAACLRRHLAVCQKALSWTLEDAVNEIIRVRKELEAVSTRVFPVGSIYVEYNNQSKPEKLWPAFVWEDITDSYAGLFFRAYGGTDSKWGEVQTECAPRITEVEYGSNGDYTGRITLPKSGWSAHVKAGDYSGMNTHERLAFYTADCEVRPANQPIRLWRRTA